MPGRLGLVFLTALPEPRAHKNKTRPCFLAMAATKARKETEQGQGFQFIAVFHRALKPERKVILKHPFTGLLSGGLEAKCAALGLQSSQEVHFPKCDSWLDVPALLFSAITFS